LGEWIVNNREKWDDAAIELAHPTIDSVKERSTYGEHFSNVPKPAIRNSVIDAICNRKSIRLFKSEAIPDEVLWTVLETARWAPSGTDIQPWYIIVIKDPEKRRRIYELTRLSSRKRTVQSRIPREQTLFTDRFTHLKRNRMRSLQRGLQKPATGRKRGRFDSRAWEAPVHLLVVGQRFNSGSMNCGVNLAVENMLIAAVSLGLGSVILGAPRQAPGTSVTDPVRLIYELFKIPINDYRIVSWICLGYPAQCPRHRPRFFIQDKVFVNEWAQWKSKPHFEKPRKYMIFPEYAV
jgi:nitroreductase